MVNKISIHDLEQPIWLITSDFKTRRKVDYIHYLEVATKLAVTEKSLLNHYLVDANFKIYKIIDIIDLGNYNKPWRFEFFNPMKKIELLMEEIIDEMSKQRIQKLVDKPDENDF